jgi:hypothetical protein
MDGYPFAGTYLLLIAKRWVYSRATIEREAEGAS